MKAVAAMIEKHVYSSQSPNSEVRKLLSMLKNFKMKKLSLIKRSLCHDNESKKSARFEKAFERLMQIKCSDIVKFNAIIKEIPYDVDWVHRVISNDFLHAVLRYKPIPFAKRVDMAYQITKFLSTPVP